MVRLCILRKFVRETVRLQAPPLMALPQIQHQSQPHLSPETVFVQVMWLQPWFFSIRQKQAGHFLVSSG